MTYTTYLYIIIWCLQSLDLGSGVGIFNINLMKGGEAKIDGDRSFHWISDWCIIDHWTTNRREGGDEVFWCGSNTHCCQHGGDRENVFHCCIHRWYNVYTTKSEIDVKPRDIENDIRPVTWYVPNSSSSTLGGLIQWIFCRHLRGLLLPIASASCQKDKC